MKQLMPSSLLARVTILVVLGMTVAQLLTFAAIRYERGQTLMNLMIRGVEHDIASSVAILDRLPPAERESWLQRLERQNYQFSLDAVVSTEPPTAPDMVRFVEILTNAMQPYPVEAVGQTSDQPLGVRLQVRLTDGTSLFVLARRVPMPVSSWVVWLLAAQLVVLATFAWLGIRLVTRPLVRLAAAANNIGPSLQPSFVEETGPAEVAQAARAFNEMQRRIAGYLNERVQILAAISHDLQTPLTRMRLRLDLMEQEPEAEKFRSDLESMRTLVQEGVAYAKTLQSSDEPVRRLDLDALVRSIAHDYADTGSPVTYTGSAGTQISSRPNALRRILSNLMDNALKYGVKADVSIRRDGQYVCVDICDAGEGIPDEHLTKVFQPFYRVEGSRNRDTGGTGLGLAIAHQLALTIEAELTLQNQPAGGLRATLRLFAPSNVVHK